VKDYVQVFVKVQEQEIYNLSPFTICPFSETAAAYDISSTSISTCFLIYVTA
jgi:hypothetical protein